MAYGAAVGVLRVAVNARGSTGSAGLDTNLAPTMTIGTGFFGRSSLGENLRAAATSCNWTRIAYANDPAEPFGDFAGLEPWSADARAGAAPADPQRTPATPATTREEIRAARSSKSCASW